MYEYIFKTYIHTHIPIQSIRSLISTVPLLHHNPPETGLPSLLILLEPLALRISRIENLDALHPRFPHHRHIVAHEPRRVPALKHLLTARIFATTRIDRVHGFSPRAVPTLANHHIQQTPRQHLIHLPSPPKLPQIIHHAPVTVFTRAFRPARTGDALRRLVADVHPFQRTGAAAVGAFLREDAVPEDQWRIVCHFVLWSTGSLGDVEEIVDEGGRFEALADEEEDGGHVADLMPEEGRAVERKSVDGWGGRLAWGVIN